MKRHATLVVALGLIVLAGAVPTDAQMRVGGVVDLNLATVSTGPPTFSGDVGTHARLGGGVVVEYRISHGLSAVIAPMLLGKGTKATATYLGTSSAQTVTLTYLELPLLAKYSFGRPEALQPYILGGPTIGFKTGADAPYAVSRAPGAPDDVAAPLLLSGKGDEVKGTDLGFGLGAGLSLPAGSARVFGEALYVIGLANVIDVPGASIKNKGLQLRLGVTVPIGSKRH
jgi:hypothetical protein